MLASLTQRFLLRLHKGRNTLVELLGPAKHSKNLVTVREIANGKEHVVTREQLRKTT